MAEVVLYVYDMTKSGNEHDAHNFSIVQMNKLLKDGINFGGIFHTAVQIYGNDEWAYGYRNKGTGIFSCPAGKNPSYTLREKIILGRTECSPSKVNKMLKELGDSWPGNKYNIVSAPDIHNEEDIVGPVNEPVIRAIEGPVNEPVTRAIEGPNDVIPIVEEPDDDEPVIHKDEGPSSTTIIDHTADKPVPMHA
ncbi:hypothetical protein HAX54_017599 [Datura stramonium]|uniref:PPPDE domain-containing protein n=1 Tax=Datura stramonium TaxID=4076 RepID=A0ABS8S0J7_DATST|nr:hypothetical protein [Datura stramonium]